MVKLNAPADKSSFSGVGINNTMTLPAVASTSVIDPGLRKDWRINSDLSALMVKELTAPMARMIISCSPSEGIQWLIPTERGWILHRFLDSYGIVICPTRARVTWDSFSGMILYSGLVCYRSDRHIFSSILTVLRNESLLSRPTGIVFRMPSYGWDGKSISWRDVGSNFDVTLASRLVTMMRAETARAIAEWNSMNYWPWDYYPAISSAEKWNGQ